ncbi:hypothetical protein LC040_09065 [Bacillus tianshenii]|nr:hypothetical protein LC040_09065 [Bacillus tianshenii]
MKRWVALFLAASLIAGCSQTEESEKEVENKQVEEQTDAEKDAQPKDQVEKEGQAKEADKKNSAEQPKSDDKKGTKQEPAKEQPKEQKPANNEDTDLTTAIKKEKGVVDGKVYTKENTAYGTLILEAGITDQQAKQLAQSYAEKLKKKYADKTVNVQAVRGKDNVANITL